MTDPGLAVERTRLAWRRTLLGALAVMLLALTHVADLTRLASIAIGLMGLCWLGIVAIANRRMGQLRAGRHSRVTTSPGAVALLITGYAGLAVALILSSG
jgi:hypothetical protein